MLVSALHISARRPALKCHGSCLGAMQNIDITKNRKLPVIGIQSYVCTHQQAICMHFQHCRVSHKLV